MGFDPAPRSQFHRVQYSGRSPYVSKGPPSQRSRIALRAALRNLSERIDDLLLTCLLYQGFRCANAITDRRAAVLPYMFVPKHAMESSITRLTTSTSGLHHEDESINSWHHWLTPGKPVISR